MIARIVCRLSLAAGSVLVLATAALAQSAAPAAGAAPVVQAPAQRQASRPAATPAGAAAAPARDKAKPPALGGFGGSAKEPIKIDADRLDVFDRENRAVFTGNVVAVQGESTIRCTVLTVAYDRGGQGGAPKPAVAAAGQTNDAIKQIDCTGPVTVVSKDQVGTGDNAVFDRVANRIIMTGNVTLSQCQNVTTGDKLVYDLNTGVANIESAMSAAGPGRVRALFVPGGGEGQANQNCKGGPTPAAAPAAPPPATQAAQARPEARPEAKPAGKPRTQPQPPPQTN